MPPLAKISLVAVLLAVAGAWIALRLRMNPEAVAEAETPVKKSAAVPVATLSPTPAPMPAPLPEPPRAQESAIAIAPPAAAPMPAPAADQPAEPALLPGFVGPATWQNRGTVTASAAFETHCWAIDRADPDVLASTVALTPASLEKLTSIFNRLPPDAQAVYGSPEKMLALLWVSGPLPFPGYMIERENVRSENEIGVILQLQYGQQGHDREFVFQKYPDGWRKVTPDAQVDNILQRHGLIPR